MRLFKVFGVVGTVVAANLVAGASVSAAPSSPATVTYRIEVQNVTGGNVLSPFLAVLHSPALKVVTLGAPARAGVAALAETGDRSVLTAELSGLAAVTSIAGAAGGPIAPGEARTLEVTVPKAAVRAGLKLDVLAMIGRSNDSFISVGGITLGGVARTATFAARNYDAGSEENTGDVEDFGPGGHPTDAAEGRVSFDRGLNLRGNAPESFAWGATAALVSVTRLP